MNIILNLFFSFTHFLLTYGILIIAIISNNMNILILLLFLTIYIKILYNMYGRCILTILEDNNKYPNMARFFIRTLTNSTENMKDASIELLLINTGLFILISKIFFLLLISHLKK